MTHDEACKLAEARRGWIAFLTSIDWDWHMTMTFRAPHNAQHRRAGLQGPPK